MLNVTDQNILMIYWSDTDNWYFNSNMAKYFMHEIMKNERRSNLTKH